jgi:hypothetical protein
LVGSPLDRVIILGSGCVGGLVLTLATPYLVPHWQGQSCAPHAGWWLRSARVAAAVHPISMTVQETAADRHGLHPNNQGTAPLCRLCPPGVIIVKYRECDRFSSRLRHLPSWGGVRLWCCMSGWHNLSMMGMPHRLTTVHCRTDLLTVPRRACSSGRHESVAGWPCSVLRLVVLRARVCPNCGTHRHRMSVLKVNYQVTTVRHGRRRRHKPLLSLIRARTQNST